METLSLLKFWRLSPADTPSPSAHLDAAAVESDRSSSTSSEDSFFDLEFTLPGQHSQTTSNNNDDVDSTLNFLDSPNHHHAFSKSEPNSKPQSPISFLRTPTKLKVLMFLKKPKADKDTTTSTTTTTPDASPSTPSRFAVKCHVDEFPIWSVLNRVNSTSRARLERKTSEGDLSKRNKGGVGRYLKMMKPLYAGEGKEVKVSGADPASSRALTRSPSKQVLERKQESGRTASLRAIYRLGKSRSSAGAGVAPVVRGSKSDDSAVLQNDGIQGAILHCKRSFNSPRGCSSQSRFASEASSSDEISGGSSSRNSSEDEKERKSI